MIRYNSICYSRRWFWELFFSQLSLCLPKPWVSENLFFQIYLYLFIYYLHLAYKKPVNLSNNTAYISVNKLASNDNNKTKYLIVRQNQHVANRLYIIYMGSQASTSLFFVWKILDYHNFLLFRGHVSIFLELCKIWSRYHILENWDFYYEQRFVF